MSLVDRSTGEVLSLPGEVSQVSLVLPDNLTFDEWAEYGKRLGRVAEGVMWWVGDWWRYGEHRYGERAAQALESDTFSFQTFANAGWVTGRIETSRRREVLSFSHHGEVAALPPSEQDELLDLAEQEGWSQKELRTEVRKRRTAVRLGIAAMNAPDLAALGEFQVLYVDPPWSYEHAEPTRALDNHYSTMTLDDIKAMRVPAGENAVLFLWATSPKLSEAFEVLDSWGFEYRTCMVWVKANEETGAQHIGMGYYARQQHELLLIARRGDLPVPAPETRPASVVVAPRTEHSSKPERFYELIESMYPGLASVELFARSNRPGWVSWGNQAAA